MLNRLIRLNRTSEHLPFIRVLDVPLQSEFAEADIFRCDDESFLVEAILNLIEPVPSSPMSAGSEILRRLNHSSQEWTQPLAVFRIADISRAPYWRASPLSTRNIDMPRVRSSTSERSVV